MRLFVFDGGFRVDVCCVVGFSFDGIILLGQSLTVLWILMIRNGNHLHR